MLYKIEVSNIITAEGFFHNNVTASVSDSDGHTIS